MPDQGVISTPERLAYWYFRLNGFFTFENFIVHPDLGSDQRTDADLLAVRFGFRSENAELPMEDDERVSKCQTLNNVVIVEVKTGMCAVNGPWTNRNQQNINRLLRAVGCVPEAGLEKAGDALYEDFMWSNAQTTIRFFAVGEKTNSNLPVPIDRQLTWGSIIDFIVSRFRNYPRQKSSVGQWTKDGVVLRDCALSATSEPNIRRAFNLYPNDHYLNENVQ